MNGHMGTRHGRRVMLPAFLLFAAALLLIPAFRLSAPLAGGVASMGTPGLFFMLGGAFLYLSGVFLCLRQHVSLKREAAAKDVLFSRLAHDLNNELAAIGAASEPLDGNDGLRQALTGAARMMSTSIYYLRLRDHTFTPPALEPVAAADFIDFLELRIRGVHGEADLKWSSQPVPESLLLHTNLGAALDSAERLVLRLFSVSADTAEVEVATLPIQNHVDVSFTWKSGSISAADATRYRSVLRTPTLQAWRMDDLSDLGMVVARDLLQQVGASVLPMTTPGSPKHNNKHAGITLRFIRG